jgi:replicative DNA helicase
MYAKAFVITPNTIQDYIRVNYNAVNKDQIIESIHGLPESKLSAEEHLPYLNDLSYKRELGNLFRKGSELLAGNATSDSIIQYVNKSTANLEQVAESKSVKEVVDIVREKIKQAQIEGPKIIRTGLKTIDNDIGFIPGTHSLIAAFSGDGKSALANQIAINILLNNPDTVLLYFSMEITEEKLIENFVSNLSETVKDRLRGKSEIKITEVEMQTIEESLQLIASMDDRIHIHYGPTDAEEMSLVIDLFAAKNRGKQIVIVADHHLLIKPGNDVQKAVNAVSKVLIFKKEQYKAVSILLCQLNPKTSETEDSQGKAIPPDLRKDIKYPGDLYMDADITMAIWKKNKVRPGENYKTESEVVELFVQKNREGEPEIFIPLVWTGKYGSFRDVIQKTYDTNPVLMAEQASEQNQLPEFDY